MDAVRLVAEESESGAGLSLGSTAAPPNLVTGDPALALFNAANFPGASAEQLDPGAGALRDITGRVTQLASDAGLDEETEEYTVSLASADAARAHARGGVLLSGLWRIRPDLTIYAGLRYELQFPFTPRNNSYSTATLEASAAGRERIPDTFCNLFQASNQPGAPTMFINFGEGTAA